MTPSDSTLACWLEPEDVAFRYPAPTEEPRLPEEKWPPL